MDNKAPNTIYVDFDQYGCVDRATEWPEDGYTEYIRKGAINDALKEIICKARPLPQSHIRLIERIIKRIKAL